MNISFDKKHLPWVIVGLLLLIIVIILVTFTGGSGGGSKTVSGGSNVDNVAVVSTDNQLTILSPQPNATVGNPFTIMGTATGPWARDSFTVQLVDDNGSILGSNTWTNPTGTPSQGLTDFGMSILHAPKTGNGKLQFILNVGSSGDTPRAVTIPVKF